MKKIVVKLNSKILIQNGKVIILYVIIKRKKFILLFTLTIKVKIDDKK